MKTLSLHISGMSCGHCLNAVSKALTGLPGVRIETVRIGRADVAYDANLITPEQIAGAVSDAGYAATPAP